MERFCVKCGSELVNGVCPNCSAAQNAPQYQQPDMQYQQQYQQQPQYQQPAVEINPNDERFKSFFMNPKEKFVCALGNGYLMNFLAGGFLGKGFAVVSDKRVYYKGISYEFVGKKLASRKDARTVDLKDITGTEVATFNPIVLVIAAVFFFIVGIFVSIAGGWRQTMHLWGLDFSLCS